MTLVRASVVAALLTVAACGGDDAASDRDRPPARASVPPDVERFVHQTFHGLERLCTRTRTGDRQLERTTTRFIRLYRRYPARRYGLTIDDESGTMLSAILVSATSSPPAAPARLRPSTGSCRRGSAVR